MKVKNSKTPGPDGLPADFYKTFCEDLADDMIELFDEITDSKVLPSSMKEAVTVLLQKDGDPLDPANQRPISLLNSDVKILSKFINEHLLSGFLEKAISTEQLCAVKGRSIHDGMILVRDAIAFGRDGSLMGYLVSWDQRKAFDMVDHDFLFAILRKMGFNEDVVCLIGTLYSAIITRIQVNGFLSDPVSIERGVRQGCPLSPSLYVVYAQVFFNFFLRNNLKGIEFPNKTTVKVSAYADDLSVFCQDRTDVDIVFHFSDKDKTCTGNELNKNKTRILSLNIRNSRIALLTHRLKVYGVIYSSDS